MGSMPLKRDLGIADWETMIKEVRAAVETESTEEGVELYK
jgi:hypothetical protein